MNILFLQEKILDNKILNLRDVGHNYGNMCFYKATLNIFRNHNIFFFSNKTRSIVGNCKDPDLIVLTLANNICNIKSCINQLNYYESIMSNYKCKKILLSIGAQNNDLRMFELLDENKIIINKFFSQFNFINLRGLYTRHLLLYNNINFDYHVLGCPSISLCKPININKFKINLYSKILFNSPSQGQIKKFINCKFMKNLIKDKSIDFLHQDSFTKTNKNRIVPYNYENWKEIVKKYDFVIGTRIHGTIIALICQIPALLLAIDSRTYELAKIFKIPYINIIGKNINLNTKKDIIKIINNYPLNFNLYNQYLNEYKENLNKELIQKFNLHI